MKLLKLNFPNSMTKLALLAVVFFFSFDQAMSQNYPILTGTVINTDNSPFLKINPAPPNPYVVGTGTQHTLIFGANFLVTPTRGIFYGGNVGVTPSKDHFGEFQGKWSTTGTWRRYLGTAFGYSGTSHTFPGGLNYLVNYHRWGDYSAHFGLRSATTTWTGFAPVETESAIKDAIITWSYEHGATANRLIFQTNVGVSDTTSITPEMYEHEWMTILGSNGNVGVGTASPSAQFEIAPTSSTGTYAMQIFDDNTTPISRFRFTKTGLCEIGDPTTIAGTPTVFRVDGNVKIVTNTTTSGNNVLDVTGNTKITGKVGINKTPITELDVLGNQLIDNGNLWIISNMLSGAKPIWVTDNSATPIDLFIVHQTGNVVVPKGNLNIAGISTNAAPIFSIQSKSNVSGGYPIDVFSTSTGSSRNLFRVTDAGDVHLPQYGGSGTRILSVNNSGLIVASAAPPTAWALTGNAVSSGTYTFGTTSTTTDVIEFKVGNVKAFELATNTSSGIYGFTNFRRNVSICGGTASTGYSGGGVGGGTGNINDEDWSLSVMSSIFGSGYSNYNEKGILVCRTANMSPVLAVGSAQIGFGYDCTSGYTSPPTTIFKFGDCSTTGDEFDLMYPTTNGINKLRIHGATTLFGHLYSDASSSLDIGSTATPFNNIIGTNVFAIDILAEKFYPNTGGVSDIGGPGPSQLFDEIYGNKFYAESLIPLNGSTTSPPFTGTSSVGSSSYYWYEVWSEIGSVSVSDRRLKENIEPLNYGLKTILSLKPYTYNYKSHKEDIHHGFIAQELKEIFPNSVVRGNETDTSYFGVLYSEIIPILTLAMQEQQKIIDSLKQKMDIVFSSNQIKEHKNISPQKEVLNQLPLLFQNHPNPFKGFTFIDYFLPTNISDAFLRIVDNNGKLVKAFPINQTGFGQIELDCSNLATGQYYYSLLVDSKVIDTKIMIIAIAD